MYYDCNSGGTMVDRMNLLRSWSRHSNYQTPKSMKDVWRTSYQNSFNGKKIGFHPDRIIVDYFTGNREIMHSPMSRHKQNMKTSLNGRAREGFRYWVLDKAKPSQCKYRHNWKIWDRGIQNCTWNW
ncbi:uncharacterized protein LOC123529791 isoform X2 [Mercenaria mercenaria]|uniref:uncharacterized protein LOC123529791 isoform X2 n=1 Tax=Mercenaria mercenaria TaxID=6596 RepID=UPI001E1D286E|nr:uncharacterized protein LOC123529791 isoform X2 [Mercenaria mercenaria]